MEEDSVIELLRRHFVKVNECLENKTNFDVLTRFSFRSTPDKAIKPQVDGEYTNPEMEFSQKLPKTFVADATLGVDTLHEQIDADLLQAETTLDVDSSDNNTSNCPEGSILDSRENRLELKKEQKVSTQKSFRKSFLSRPVTPVFQINDLDEENDTFSSVVADLQESQKFIHSVQPLQQNEKSKFSADSLSEWQYECRNDIEETVVKKIEPDSSFDVSTTRKNIHNFEHELEQYKKDVRLDNAIKSLSANDAYPSFRTVTRINLPSSSSDDSPLKCKMKMDRKEPRDKSSINSILRNDTEFGKSFTTEAPSLGNTHVADTSPYFKNIFKDSSSDIGSSSPDTKSSFNFGFFLQEDKGIVPKKAEIDDQLLEASFEKLFKRKSSNNPNSSSREWINDNISKENVKPESDEMNFATRNYIFMNHLEIQRGMAKRIEDLYKAGDTRQTHPE